jgi:predicted O-linked N-acetylglucosamine transferase (SPINDLY family)
LIQALISLAQGLKRIEKYQNAIEVCLEILDLNPNHGILWNFLALNYYKIHQYQEAQDSIYKAITIEPLSASNYYILGLILEKENKYPEAINAFQEAIKRDSKFVNFYSALADIYLKTDKLTKTIEICQKALEIFPRDMKILKKLGDSHGILGNCNKANFYWGYSAYFSDQYGSMQTALKHFEEFYSTSSTEVDDNFDFYNAFSNCYVMCNQPDVAVKVLKKAEILFPQFRITIKRLNQVVLPILYRYPEELDLYYQRFQQLLTELIKETKLDTKEDIADILLSLNIRNNFYLSYQGKNDREIQQRYGNYVHSIMQKMHPEWCQPTQQVLPINSRKIRIGYISSRLGTLGSLYLGWLEYCDKNKFEIYVYDVLGWEDDKWGFKKSFKLYSDYFRTISREINWEEISRTIIVDQLDILIFPDFALEEIFTFLGHLRLAPIQCATWTHPITSGSPTIDYFLSSDLMEPRNGDEHYSEKLIRLPNLGFSLYPITIKTSEKQRSDFQLKDDAIIYLCCQSLFKYLPQHDYIFSTIAQHSDSFQFIFVEAEHGELITQDFKERLDRAFSQLGLDYQKYCILLPRLGKLDYFKLHELSDIFLDNFSFSGGITTRDAIASSLPVVTCPGKIMRARQSYGMLRMIGVTDTIAETEAEYIEIAVRLGLDHEWRQTVRDKITANKHRLFNDQKCVKGLESFFEEAVQKYSKMKLISGDLSK